MVTGVSGNLVTYTDCNGSGLVELDGVQQNIKVTLKI